MSAWHEGTLALWDTETSGVDVENDRIVTSAVLTIAPARWESGEINTTRWTAVERLEWTINPGVEIPKAASDIHGITTEVARAKGWAPAKALTAISRLLAEKVAEGLPLVVMNAPYDLTLLDRELHRHGLAPLAEQAGREPLVIDPFVLDKALDTYRKGKRNLGALCAHYGVTLEKAHDAAADCLGAGQVAVRIVEKHPALGRLTLTELHEQQKRWAAVQARSLANHFRAKGQADRAANVRADWPLVPRQPQGGDR